MEKQIEILIVQDYSNSRRLKLNKVLIFPSRPVLKLITFLDRCSAVVGDGYFYRTILVVWTPTGNVYLDPYKTWEQQGASSDWVVHVYKPSLHKQAAAA